MSNESGQVCLIKPPVYFAPLVCMSLLLPEPPVTHCLSNEFILYSKIERLRKSSQHVERNMLNKTKIFKYSNHVFISHLGLFISHLPAALTLLTIVLSANLLLQVCILFPSTTCLLYKLPTYPLPVAALLLWARVTGEEEKWE